MIIDKQWQEPGRIVGHLLIGEVQQGEVQQCDREDGPHIVVLDAMLQVKVV
jgi:hypothetical protein